MTTHVQQVPQEVDPGTNLRVSDELTASPHRFGFASAAGVFILSVAYAVPLAIGLLTLPSPDVPIADPWFTMMEVLICLTWPVMVTLMAAIHVWAPASRKPFSLAALVFMALAAVVSSSVHFTVLTLSRQAAITSLPWAHSLLSFQWPSVPYVLDILAWDFFFPLSVLLAAPVFGGSRLGMAIRTLLVISGVVSLLGLVGVVVNDMQVRNIGIVGYAVVYPVAALLIARLFLPGRSGQED